jgi:lysophospholipase
VTLRAQSFPATGKPKGTVVYFTGWNESYIKYWELFDDLNKAGYNVHTLDHRSQGLSGRPSAIDVSSANNVSYVDDFQSYVDDAAAYAASVAGGEKVAIVAHSMGGLVTLNLAASHPASFACCVLCAPMICFKTEPWPWSVAGFLSGVFCSLGFGKKHAIGFPKANWEPERMNLPDRCSHSDERNKTWIKQQFNFPLVSLSGPSNQWVRACYLACDKFMRSFVYGVEKFPVPYMMVRAGKDRFVHEQSQDDFLEVQAAFGKTVSLPEAYHEVYVEEDAYRAPVVSEVIRFLDAHCGGKKKPSADDAIYDDVVLGGGAVEVRKEKGGAGNLVLVGGLLFGLAAVWWGVNVRRK